MVDDPRIMNADNNDVSLRQLNGNDDISGNGGGSDRANHRALTPGSWWRCTPIKMSPSVRVAMASSMAAVGGVMFGYDTGDLIINALMNSSFRLKEG